MAEAATVEDEWTDNYDPGFVELSVSDADFSELQIGFCPRSDFHPEFRAVLEKISV